MEDTVRAVAEAGEAIEPFVQLARHLASLSKAFSSKKNPSAAGISYDIQGNELLEIVSGAQLAAIEAQSVQAMQSARIRELEEQIKRYDNWEQEEKRYFLKQVGQAGYVYCLKEEYISKHEPRHFICPTCAGNSIKTLVQQEQDISPQLQQLKCPRCDTTIAFSWRFLDSSS